MRMRIIQCFTSTTRMLQNLKSRPGTQVLHITS